MGKQKTENPLELMAKLEGAVVKMEQASDAGDVEALKSAEKGYLNVIIECGSISDKNLAGDVRKQVYAKMRKLPTRANKAMEPHLMKIYFPEVCGGDE